MAENENTNPGTVTSENESSDSEGGWENPGIKGQLQYPEVEVDAERAAAFAAGKADTLYEDDDPGVPHPPSWNPMLQDRETGDETGEETEPTENPDWDPNDPKHSY